MSRKIIFLLGVVLVLLEPLVFNIVQYSGWHHGFIAESSIYSLDRGKYFNEFLRHKSIFSSGQYTTFLLNYAVWYVLWSTLSAFLPNIVSYFVLIIAFYLIGLYFFIRLFLFLTDSENKEVTFEQISVVALLGLLYFSSLSMFNYIKSNAFFVLPYLILPALLYCSLRFVRDGNKRFLLLYFLVSLVLTDLNLAHALILAIFINVFLLLQRRHIGLGMYEFLKRIAVINGLLIPAFCLLLMVVVDNAIYSADISTFAVIAAENMYSNSTGYLNILSQLTDWGLFGSWKGIRYYEFSQFYTSNVVRMSGLVPFVLLGFAALIASKSSRLRSLAISMMIVLLIIVQVMLGSGNPVYQYLYGHIVVFQIFRNITKLAPLLYLVLLFAIYLFVHDRLEKRRNYCVIIALIACALVYNAPFWSYQGYFFGDRSVRDIPPYWEDAATYINETVNPYSKILSLPAIYINDIYSWDGKLTWVQGSLLDVLVKNENFRLSECCIGPPQFQFDAQKVFVPSERSIRKRDVDYLRLTDLVKRYHLDYVILTQDLVSEYQDVKDIKRWLSKAGYSRVALFGSVSIYRNAGNFAPRFSGGGLYFQKTSNLSYRVYLRSMRSARDLVFRQPFHRGWELYLRARPSSSWCGAIQGVPEGSGSTSCSDAAPTLGIDELKYLFQAPDFLATHREASGASNAWRLDPTYIKSHYSKEYYTQNPDGSINIEVGLYFRPQGYTIAAFLVGGSLLVTLFGVLVAQSLWASQGRRSYYVAAFVLSLLMLGVIHFASTKAGEPSVVRSGRVQRVADVMRASARAAASVYVPATCGRLAESASCSSVRFESVDSSDVRHYWGFEYNAASEQLSECVAYTSREADCPSNARGATVVGVTRFSSLPIPTQRPFDPDARAALSRRGNGSTQPPLSLSQNRAVLVTVESGGASIETHLTPGHAHFTAGIISEPLSLPHIGSNVEAPDPELAFYSPFQVQGRVSVALRNFGHYARFASTPWGLSPCGVPAVDELPKRANASDNIDVTVIPRNAGSCVFYVTADPNDKQSPAEAAAIHINVMGALSWSPLSPKSHESLVFVSTIAPPQMATMYKTYDNQVIIPTVVDKRCAKISAFVAQPGSAPETLSVSPASTTIVARPIAAGSCSASLQSQWGASGDPLLHMNVRVMSDLSLAPSTVLSSTELSFAGTRTAPKTIDLYKTYDASEIVPTFAANGCSAIAAFEVQRSFVPQQPSRVPATTKMLVRPISPGQCTAALGDQYGAYDRTVSVRVNVAPFITFESTIAPPQVISSLLSSEAGVSSRAKSACTRLLEFSRPPAAASFQRTAVAIRPIAPGYCRIIAYENHGGHRLARTGVTALVMGDLSLARSTRIFSTKLTFRSPSDVPQNFRLYKAYDNEPIVPSFVDNGCFSIAGFYPQGGNVPTLPSSTPTWTAVLVRPSRPGTCTSVFADQYGAHDRTVSVRVTVGRPGH